jgi:Protein of unknown function (DUF3592)
VPRQATFALYDLAKPAVVIVALSWSEVAFCQNEGGRHHSDTPGAGWQPPDPLLATRSTASEAVGAGQMRTDMAGYGSPDHTIWPAHRRRIALVAMMTGLLLCALAAWRFSSRTAFADRAVTATAVIDDVDQGPFLASEDGQRSFTVYATVRYHVDGTLAQGRVSLSGCGRGACPARHQRGDTITIAYDPRQVTSIDLASRVVGRHPLLDPRVLALVLLGVSFLVAAAVNLLRSP